MMQSTRVCSVLLAQLCTLAGNLVLVEVVVAGGKE